MENKKKKKIGLSYDLLENIAIGMDNQSYEMSWYLDIQNEETTLLSDYSDDEEGLAEMIENDIDEERFIPIPTTTSDKGWEQMERFIMSLNDQDKKTCDLLLTTIQGSGAFGRFKDAIYRIGLDERWFEFKEREDIKEVLDWLLSIELISDEDIEKGIRLHEQHVSKRKQRKKDIANMIKGAQVKCVGNVGHEDKLTLGNVYEVLDEKPEHLNIRIKDDRDKICWLPKSHFELIYLNKA